MRDALNNMSNFVSNIEDWTMNIIPSILESIMAFFLTGLVNMLQGIFGMISAEKIKEIFYALNFNIPELNDLTNMFRTIGIILMVLGFAVRFIQQMSTINADLGSARLMQLFGQMMIGIIYIAGFYEINKFVIDASVNLFFDIYNVTEYQYVLQGGWGGVEAVADDLANAPGMFASTFIMVLILIGFIVAIYVEALKFRLSTFYAILSAGLMLFKPSFFTSAMHFQLKSMLTLMYHIMILRIVHLTALGVIPIPPGATIYFNIALAIVAFKGPAFISAHVDSVGGGAMVKTAASAPMQIAAISRFIK